jgi:hypothetical protein
MKNFTKSILVLLITLSANYAFALPKLNSLTSATATIFLDFDGQTVSSAYWNAGNKLLCAAPALTDAQITEIFQRVSEDYRPFNVNITTDSAKFLSAPLTRRIRIVITPTSSWKPNVGGISFVGSFTWGDNTPGFVFSDRLGPNNTKFIAECCSHESGHTLGLSHQSKYNTNCTLAETYSTGNGTGETGWAPIMGNSYNRNMTGWNNGPTPYGCANTQDNLSIITNANGFGYRTDDYSYSLNSSSSTLSTTSFSRGGIITTNTDKDVFRFQFTQNSTLHIDAIPYSNGNGNSGSNLDIKLLLYNESKQLIRTYDPLTSLSVTLDTTLKTGIYYLVLDGTGNANANNYSSIGSYTLTGFRGALPITKVSLNGSSIKNAHQLNWDIITDEPVQQLEIESSINGELFNAISTAKAETKLFTCLPTDEKNRFYRLKATSVYNQIMYSNIIYLKGIESKIKAFTIGNFVSDKISLTANENYQYKLMDNYGRVLEMGSGYKGIQQINMLGKSAGIYFLQIFGTIQKMTERIVKQ